MLHGSYPWHSAHSLATCISTIFVPAAATKADCDIVRCHLNQPIRSKTAWAIVYVNDKDTNYIIARLRTNKAPWEETEIRRVHKGYWQQL